MSNHDPKLDKVNHKLDKVNHEVDFDNSSIDFDADNLLADFDDASLELDTSQSHHAFDVSDFAIDDPYFNDIDANQTNDIDSLNQHNHADNHTDSFNASEFNASDDFGDFEEIDFHLDEPTAHTSSTEHVNFDHDVKVNSFEVDDFEVGNFYVNDTDDTNAMDSHLHHQSENMTEVPIFNDDSSFNDSSFNQHSTDFQSIDTQPHTPPKKPPVESAIDPTVVTATTAYQNDNNNKVADKNHQPKQANKMSKLLGKKEPKNKKPALKKSAKQLPPNLLKPLMALIVLGILGVLAFLFLSNQGEPMATDPIINEPMAVIPDTPPAPNESADLAAAAEQAQPTTQADVTADTSADDVSNALDVPDSVSVENTTAVAKPKLTADDILTAEIPKDPALIKEEIDKLQQQEELYSQQEELLKEQIKDMEALTKDKAEHIALLEKQIAQLETQKTQ